jgi:hypothetical protein
MSKITTGRRIDRRNRVRFVLLGLLLLLLGAAGLLIQAGLLQDLLRVPIDAPGDYYRQVRGLAADYPAWTIAALVALGLLLFLLGALLLRGQVPTPATRVRELTLQNGAGGSTVVDADVVSDALARDLERLPDVHDASARLVAAGARPRLAVRATVDGAADLTEVRGAMEEAYQRVQTVLGAEGVDANLHVKEVPSRRTRVR